MTYCVILTQNLKETAINIFEHTHTQICLIQQEKSLKREKKNPEKVHLHPGTRTNKASLW